MSLPDRMTHDLYSDARAVHRDIDLAALYGCELPKPRKVRHLHLVPAHAAFADEDDYDASLGAHQADLEERQ